MFAIASVAGCPISLSKRAEEDTDRGALLILLGSADTRLTSVNIKRIGTERTLLTSASISVSGDADGARNTPENHAPTIANGVEETLERYTTCVSAGMLSTAASGINETA